MKRVQMLRNFKAKRNVMCYHSLYQSLVWRVPVSSTPTPAKERENSNQIYSLQWDKEDDTCWDRNASLQKVYSSSSCIPTCTFLQPCLAWISMLLQWLASTSLGWGFCPQANASSQFPVQGIRVPVPKFTKGLGSSLHIAQIEWYQEMNPIAKKIT